MYGSGSSTVVKFNMERQHRLNVESAIMEVEDLFSGITVEKIPLDQLKEKVKEAKEI